MKKRILSLILALSMVLSVLPLGAFAEGSTQDLVMGANGLPDCSNGTSGNGWSYDAHMKKLTLTSDRLISVPPIPKAVEKRPQRLCDVRLRFNRVRQLPAAPSMEKCQTTKEETSLTAPLREK